MRILITGVTGFAGGHLAERLLAEPQYNVVGLSRQSEWPPVLAHLRDRIALRSCDLADGPAIERLLREVQPQRIFHLAGYAHAGRSFQESDAAWAGNLHATRNLYDAVIRWNGRPRILSVGSGLVYGEGKSPEDSFAEDAPFRPTIPYATSKAAADLLGYQYSRNPGLDIVRARPFNHTGPRQAPEYAVPSFAKQIAAIECGRQAPLLETGNLTPRRDLTDVRDVVNAYQLLAERGKSGEAYNIARGASVSMQTVLERLLARSAVRVEIRARADLLRASDAAVVQGNATRLAAETGWRPRYSLDQTLTDTLDYWRQVECS